MRGIRIAVWMYRLWDLHVLGNSYGHGCSSGATEAGEVGIVMIVCALMLVDGGFPGAYVSGIAVETSAREGVERR